MNGPKKVLELQNVSHSYGGRPVLNNLSMEISSGEIISVIGCSGVGKTTLFRLISGIESVQHGTLQRHTDVTYMTQDDLLLPWRTVRQNMLLLCELNKRPVNDETLHNLLAEVGLLDHANHYPNQLSGGQRQRVSLARSLLQGHPLMLLDEPFGALDLITRERMYELLLAAARRHQLTLLIITHDFRDAMHLSDRILLLSNGQISDTWNRGTATESTLRDALIRKD